MNHSSLSKFSRMLRNNVLGQLLIYSVFLNCNSPTQPTPGNDGTKSNPKVISIGSFVQGNVLANGESYYELTPQETGCYDIIVTSVIPNFSKMYGLHMFLTPVDTNEYLFGAYWGSNMPYIFFDSAASINLTKNHRYILTFTNQDVMTTTEGVKQARNTSYSFTVTKSNYGEGSAADPINLDTLSPHQGTAGNSGVSIYSFIANGCDTQSITLENAAFDHTPWISLYLTPLFWSSSNVNDQIALDDFDRFDGRWAKCHNLLQGQRYYFHVRADTTGKPYIITLSGCK